VHRLGQVAKRTTSRFKPNGWRVALAAGSLLVPVVTAQAEAVRPQFSRRLDAPLLASGVALTTIAIFASPEVRSVPDAGLDPAAIHLDFDRDIVGNRDVDAHTASDVLLYSACAFPFALSFASAPSGERWSASLDRTVLFVESLALAGGITAVAKVVVSRPRPYTYLSISERPDHSKYDVQASRAFESMPSGHATTTWCAASFGVVDHVLTRPAADWKEHAAVGFAGGALAASASVLRVEAGQHFPTDVLVGTGIGIAGGVTIPLLHRYVIGNEPAPSPSRDSWLAAAAGMAAGTVAVLLVNAAVGP